MMGQESFQITDMMGRVAEKNQEIVNKIKSFLQLTMDFPDNFNHNSDDIS